MSTTEQVEDADSYKALQRELKELRKLSRIMASRHNYEKTNLDTRIMNINNKIANLDKTIKPCQRNIHV